MSIEFQANGNVKPGFHNMTLAEFKKDFVDAFQQSKTRSSILDGYIKLINILSGNNLVAEQWLDGNYCSNKVDPNDLDLLSILDKDTLDKLPPASKQALSDIFGGPNTKKLFCCDSYLLSSVPDSHPNYQDYLRMRKYWMGQFGFDRNDEPKGIIRVIAGSGHTLAINNGGVSP